MILTLLRPLLLLDGGGDGVQSLDGFAGVGCVVKVFDGAGVEVIACRACGS